MLRDPECPLPLDTPDAVLKTAAVLAAEAAPEPLWVAQTRAAAALMNVIDSVDAILPVSKTAATDARFFAIVKDDCKYFPLRTARDISDATDFVTRNDGAHGDDYVEPSVRRKIATRVLERAAQLGMTLPNDMTHELLLQSGDGTCRVEDIRDALGKRAAVLRGEDGGKLRKMAVAVQRVPDQATLRQLVDELAELDARRGIVPLYKTSGLLPPERQLHANTRVTERLEKLATVTLPDGTKYATAQLAQRLDPTQLRAWLGTRADDLLDVVTGGVAQHKLALVLPTLADDDVDDFTAAARAAGVVPVTD